MRMEEELKHVCRLCKKRYPSGKSLGGHMRSHAIANSNASSPSSLHKLKLKKKKKKKKALVFTDTNGYGLRENPRKTWRMMDTNANQERLYEQRGKSSQSIKALCGHMSSHSERDRNFTNSWASDGEDECSVGRSVAMVGFSSGVEHEQEELAMCLMMLSRDSGQTAGFNFTTGSSDNSSTNGSVEELDNSESGYFENGAKELESTDDSVHGFNGSELLRDENVVKIAHLSPAKGPNKAGRYICSALGGRHGREDIKNGSYNGENEKRKGHFCPFCPKVFKSGQALGGHKRSHFIGCSSQDIQENSYRRLLDLNLPAPVEEDGNEGSDGQIKPW